MALIALFILVMPSRQRAGGGGERAEGWERVKPEGGREQPSHGVLAEPARNLLTQPPRGTIRALW